jgi:lipopolysaccharide transport system ATP-binding protein
MVMDRNGTCHIDPLVHIRAISIPKTRATLRRRRLAQHQAHSTKHTAPITKHQAPSTSNPMSSIISVENLSKAYRIGKQQERADSLVGMLRDSLFAPFRNWRSFRQPTKAESESGNGEDAIHWALRNLSFDVNNGEVLGIIGRNGAGKSTLLKVLSRITEPTSGRVRLRGRVSSLLEVGTGFHPELSGYENVYLNGTILGMTKREIDRKFDEIVEFSGVEKFLDTPVKRYSSGMKVRLAFAVAAHLEPEILIVDEVLAVGDANFQKKCLGKMKEVAHAGRTVVFVTHQLEMLDRLTQRCLWLENGGVKTIGETGTITAEYIKAIPCSTSLVSNEILRRPNTVEFLNATAVDNTGTPQTLFQQGEKIAIELHLRSEIKTKFDVAIVVENEREQPLFASHFTDFHSPLTFQGSMFATMCIDPPILRNGRYRVSLALFSHDSDFYYHVIHHHPLFEVFGSDNDAFPKDSRWGSLFLRMHWSQRG